MKTSFKVGQEISFVLENHPIKNNFKKDTTEGKGIIISVKNNFVMVVLNENCGLFQRGDKMPVFYEEIKSEE